MQSPWRAKALLSYVNCLVNSPVGVGGAIPLKIFHLGHCPVSSLQVRTCMKGCNLNAIFFEVMCGVFQAYRFPIIVWMKNASNTINGESPLLLLERMDQ